MDELKLSSHGELVISLATIEHYTQGKSVCVEGGDVAAPY
jgi:hypothetical protein